MTEELTRKYAEALMEEKEAFYLYKHVFKAEEDAANRASILAIMEDELKHYEKLASIMFGVTKSTSAMENIFKDMVMEDKEKMKGCLSALKKE